LQPDESENVLFRVDFKNQQQFFEQFQDFFAHTKEEPKYDVGNILLEWGACGVYSGAPQICLRFNTLQIQVYFSKEQYREQRVVVEEVTHVRLTVVSTIRKKISLTVKTKESMMSNVKILDIDKQVE